MKTIILLSSIYICAFIVSAESQNESAYWDIDTNSNFNKPHCPFTDALSMWVLQQNLSIDGHSTLIGSDISLADQGLSVVENNIEVFMPVFKIKGLYSMFGTAYSRKSIYSNNRQLNKPLTSFTRFWFPIQYCANKWRFMLLYENFLRGDEESLFNETGNTQRLFVMISYAFGHKWQLTVFIVSIEDHMENEINKKTIPAIQVRFNPSKNILIAAGAPLLFGFEWSLHPKIDLYFSQVLSDKTHFFIKYDFTESTGLSFHYSYLLQGSQHYFDSEPIHLPSQLVNFNSITQRQNVFALKFGINPVKNIGILLSCKYTIGAVIKLYNNNDYLTHTDGGSRFSIGLNLQYTRFH